jgi:hypothetical protein
MKTVANVIELPCTLTDLEIDMAFAGNPEVFAFLTPNMRAFLKRNPDCLNIVVENCFYQADTARAKVEIRKHQVEIAEAIHMALPTEFLASLPAVVGGFTQEQPDYWLEPEVKWMRVDSEQVIISGATSDINCCFANRMAPRFLNGVSFVAEEVLPGEELIMGNVYYKYDSEMNRGELFRLLGAEKYTWKASTANPTDLHGYRFTVEYDADQVPAEAKAVGLHDTLTYYPDNGQKLYRFLKYKTFRGIILPTTAYQKRKSDASWNTHIERVKHSAYTQEENNRKARERRALRKAGLMDPAKPRARRNQKRLSA